MTDSGWICTACGTDNASPLDGRFGAPAQFDERYTTGYCNTCSDPNPKVPRKTPRPTSVLIRANLFNPARFAERKERDELAKLVQEAAGHGKGNFLMSDARLDRLITLWDKYQPAGYVPPQGLRDAVTEYRAKFAKVSPLRKRR